MIVSVLHRSTRLVERFPLVRAAVASPIRSAPRRLHPRIGVRPESLSRVESPCRVDAIILLVERTSGSPV
jgi:hypothetical protein